MCGRFSLTVLDLASVASTLGLPEVPRELAALYRPRYNVAPSQPHVVARATSEAPSITLDWLGWGLRRSDSFTRHDPSRGRAGPFALARVETVATSPAFRRAYREQRCVVPVDGFYEWGGVGPSRAPSWFHEEGRVFFLAGIAELGARDHEPARGGFALLTAPATDAVLEVHDRMPVLLEAADVPGYLAAAPRAGDLRDLGAARAKRLVRRRVSRHVNTPSNDDEACIASIAEGIVEGIAEGLNGGGARPGSAPREGRESWHDLPLFKKR